VNRTASSVLVPALMFGLLCSAACNSLPDADPDLTQRLEHLGNDESAKLLDHATRLLLKGRHEEALALLQAKIDSNPGCARLALLLLRAASMLDTEARRTKLAELERTYERLYDHSKSDRDTLAFGVALFTEVPDKRRVWIARALRYNKHHYYALVLEGDRLYRLGELDESKQKLKLALALRPELAEAWLLLSQIAEEQNLAKLTQRYYTTYLDLRPLDRNVRLNFARFLTSTGYDLKEARVQIDRLLEDDPRDLEANLHLAAVYWKTGRHQDALRLYKRLLARHPLDVRVCVNLGNLYYQVLDDAASAWRVYTYLVGLPVSRYPSVALEQKFFVPNRIKKIAQALGDRLPQPPKSVGELL